MGLPDFAFGVYGHEADKGGSIEVAYSKATAYFGKAVRPRDIIVIGDTVNDIRCARVIGALVVIVNTGWRIDKETLIKAKPDLFVDTLLDERVLTLLGLEG